MLQDARKIPPRWRRWQRLFTVGRALVVGMIVGLGTLIWLHSEPSIQGRTRSSIPVPLEDLHMETVEDGWAVDNAQPSRQMIVYTRNAGRTWIAATPPTLRLDFNNQILAMTGESNVSANVWDVLNARTVWVVAQPPQNGPLSLHPRS